jgi:hypothetical protein
VDVTVHTKRRRGQDACPRCLQLRHGGLGGNRIHTCQVYETPGQQASRERDRRLRRIGAR